VARNLYILAGTLLLFAAISFVMAMTAGRFQPNLPASGTLWKTTALFLTVGGLLVSLLGVITALFEQIDRRTELRRIDRANRRKPPQHRARRTSPIKPLPIEWKQGTHAPEKNRPTMYELTVERGFSSGHYLRNYKGKCENPHGHNYKVKITLRGESLDHAGLLLDFRDLKLVMHPVIDRLDHQMLNDLEPFTTLNPSAENLAKYFYDETNRQLAEMTGGRVHVKDCTIYETDTTTATYYE